MTGGYGMHIHSYQIHNVLNVYRRQLSRGTTRNVSGDPDRNKATLDRIDISDHGQRQTLFEKISSEIVQRITPFGPDADMEAALSGHLANTSGRVQEKAVAPDGKNPVFSYTLIDTNNQKTTHNMSVRQLNHSAQTIKSSNTALSDSESIPGSE
jgi:hypothetical protein